MLKLSNKTGFLLIALSILVICGLVVFYYLAPDRSSVMPVASQALEQETNYDDLDPAMKELAKHLIGKAIANIINSSALSLTLQAHLAPFLAPHAPLGPICQIYLSYIVYAR